MDVFFSMIPFALILCVGIFVQAAAGFAAGLMIIPALLYCGYSIPAAQCALLVATIPQNVWGAWSLRESISVQQIVWPGIGRVTFLPLGVWVLHSMESLPTETLRQIVGAIVLAATLSIIVFRPQPRQSIHPIWGLIAFPISGFLQGLVGMGGPAMVFWIQAHDWGSKQTRGFLFAMYLVSMIPAVGFLYFAFGQRIVPAGLIATSLIPLLLGVTIVGLRFGNWLGRERLRRVTLALLLLLGISGLAAPLLAPY